jgi:hypothetical protein
MIMKMERLDRFLNRLADALSNDHLTGGDENGIAYAAMVLCDCIFREEYDWNKLPRVNAVPMPKHDEEDIKRVREPKWVRGVFDAYHEIGADADNYTAMVALYFLLPYLIGQMEDESKAARLNKRRAA